MKTLLVVRFFVKQIKLIPYALLCTLLVGCDGQPVKEYSPSQELKYSQPKVVNIHPDSLRVITPGQNGVPLPQTVKAGKPKVVTNRILSMLAGKPNVVVFDTTQLKRRTPGENGIPLPLTHIIPDRGYLVQHGDTVYAPVSVLAKHPEPVSALQPRFKDNAVYNIQYLDVDQGMPSSYVTSMIEDQAGNIWIGTEGGGTSRYDGSSFTSYTEREGLVKNTVYSILEDKNENLWFGTDGGGVSRYDGTSFTSFTEREGLVNNSIHSILEDKNGNLWFATWGGGVSFYDGTSFTSFTAREGLETDFVRSILEDKSGNLWFATNGGVSRYDGTSFTSFTEREGLVNNDVLSILEDKDGDIWFGTSGGVSRYNGHSFASFTEREGLENNFVRSALEDKNGHVWFATNGGVSHYDGLEFTSYTEVVGLASNYVRSILEDKSGNLWFGTYGGGLVRHDRNVFTSFTESEGLANNIVLSILEDTSGDLWFSTWGGGVCRYDDNSFTSFTLSEGLASNRILSSLEDQNGNIWFGSHGSGLSRYDGNSFSTFDESNGLVNNIVFSMLEDKKGDLWFGTYGGGLSCYNGSYFTSFDESDGLVNNIVFSILEDKNGILWFGTSNGLSCFDGKSFTNFTEAEGLVNNSVYSLFECKNGNLWIGTGGGLSILADGDLKVESEAVFKNFTTEDGLPNNIIMSFMQDQMGKLWIGTEGGVLLLNEPADMNLDPRNYQVFTQQDGLKGLVALPNSVCLDKKNRVWWGTSKGLSMLDVKTFQTPTGIPSIQFNGLDINGVFVDYGILQDSLTKIGGYSSGKEENMNFNEIGFNNLPSFKNYPNNLYLPYDLNHLTFHYSAIEWEAPHKIRYQFKLEGLDENWNELTYESNVEYRNLLHGAYIFKVKAIGATQIWSETFEYPFTIRPAWWLTWWAKTLWIGLGLGLFFAIYKFRLSTLKIQKIKLEFRINEQTLELKEQNVEISLKKDELEVLNHEKSKLIGMVAHDLRSPLNAVKGLIYLTRIEKNEAEKERYMELITTSADRMTDMVNRILDVSALESKTLNLRMEKVDLVDMVSQLMIIFKMSANKKDQKLVLSNTCESAQVKIDKNYFIQVLENIVSNAVKYSEYSSEINITLEQVDQYFRLTVQDQGQGISEKEQTMLFKEFSALSSKTTGSEKATGLGLSIVKKYVEAMEGKIWCESEVGKGSKFIIQLERTN